jgi:pimeloyl-ACP methyl ester carboxylesterase
MDDATRTEVQQLMEEQRRAADPRPACRAFNAVFVRGYLADRSRMPAFRATEGTCDMPLEALRNSDTVRIVTTASLGDWDLRPQLRSLRIPTLVIHGSHEPIPVEAAREWAESIPGSVLKIVENSGHFPYAEQPGPYFAAVMQFLGVR